jgi:polyhydroxybutyrate depolymerase
MNRLTALLIFILFSCTSFAQQTINGSIMHDGLQRDFILYVPANYAGENPVPLVLNFHGYTSNASQQMWYGDFRPVADTAGFIIVHPEGTLFQGSTHWNVGGWTIGSTVDDVGFVAALIDSLAISYQIDLTRVYSTGMSNGGYMSFLLACQLSDKIAAVASVTGSMTPQTYDACDPQHPTPVMQIHGTTDGVVPYDGALWTKSIDDVLQYWVDYNNCQSNPEITGLPNTSTIDGSTVEHFVYKDGDNGATTEHFKVDGGDHTWPGNIFGGTGTNQDINASLEIWNFFARYDINGLISTTAVEESKANKFNVFPNPVSTVLTIESSDSVPGKYHLESMAGQPLATGEIGSKMTELDLSQFPAGVYFLKIGQQSFKVLKL